MSGPERVQLRRTKGWRKPDNTIVVARPSKWGNKWQPISEVGRDVPHARWRIFCHDRTDAYLLAGHGFETRNEAIADCIDLYRSGILAWIEDEWGHFDDPAREALAELRGRNLACWCPLDQPCHADVLLELANSVVTG